MRAPVALNSFPNLVLSTFFFFQTTRTAYGSSYPSSHRGPIRAVAAGLHHSHSNTGSKLHLRLTPQLAAMLDP